MCVCIRTRTRHMQHRAPEKTWLQPGPTTNEMVGMVKTWGSESGEACDNRASQPFDQTQPPRSWGRRAGTVGSHSLIGCPGCCFQALVLRHAGANHGARCRGHGDCPRQLTCQGLRARLAVGFWQSLGRPLGCAVASGPQFRQQDGRGKGGPETPQRREKGAVCFCVFHHLLRTAL